MRGRPDPELEWVYVDNLVGSDEICTLLHVRDVGTLHNIRKRATDRGWPFPEPVKTLSGAMIWDRTDVVRWGVERGYLNEDETFKGHPKAGRPRKSTD